MVKKSDYIIISIICFFLGVFLYVQYKNSENFNKVLQPETNAVLALEVSKLSAANSNLRSEVQKMTADLDTYQNSSLSEQKLYEKYQSDFDKYDVLSGAKQVTGQGVKVSIDGKISVPQMVDLINAIKNIGSGIISVDDKRIIIDTDLADLAGRDKYEIKVIGNSSLLKSALTRSGGIVEQISNKDMKITVSEEDNLTINAGEPIGFIYARIVND